MLFPEILAGRCARIKERTAAGGNNQSPGSLLKRDILSGPVENILVMADGYDTGLRKMLQDPDCARMLQDGFLYINMMDLPVKAGMI